MTFPVKRLFSPSGPMVSSTRLAFLTICFASAPVDVIDLLGNSHGFHLTPFLLISCLYCLLLIFEQVAMRAIAMQPPRLHLLDSSSAACFLFVILMWTSVLFRSHDPQGLALPRALFNTWLMLFARLFVAREKSLLPQVFAKGARLFIICDSTAVAIQIVISLMGLSPPGIVYGLASTGVAGILRPSGLLIDPNRSSVTLVLFMGLAYLVGNALQPSQRVGKGYYVVGTILSLVTISRTGLVALALLGMVPLVRSERKVQLIGRILATLFLVVTAVTIYLISIQNLSTSLDQVQLALVTSKQREASTSLHFKLIASGIRAFTESPKTFLIGVGWGTEYEKTGEFFQDSKYSNYHCEYVSIAVQTGIAGLVCFLFLLLKPVILSLRSRPLSIVLIWSSTFYQYHGDPFWWIVIISAGTIFMTRFDAAPHSLVPA